MRSITFEKAKSQFVNRFTLEHVPAWALKAAPNGRYYAPQFASDLEWYHNTKFHGEPGHFGKKSECYTTDQTWPFGKWLTAPFVIGGTNISADPDVGYLQHGVAPGPFRTEAVTVKQDKWPNADKWLAHFDGRWRRVFVQVNRTFINHNGERITIKIDGV